ncbi:CHASE2 domain-containing protein [Oceanicella actignis]|uniref:CHASE2 domain-containing protein n=1 Tax=Oceanicella actignis TaxID=1189325 RepID=UPI0011E6C542|nr:adenylate/guanylate cyclase domain-containing protein [Oceanicella actignis]TYO90818.1 class 3 adenylate cyclase [Oceanicella actignis]
MRHKRKSAASGWAARAGLALLMLAACVALELSALGDRAARSIDLPILYTLRGAQPAPPDAAIVTIDRASADWLANNAEDLAAVSSVLAQCPGAAEAALNARVGDVRLRAIYACLVDWLSARGARLIALDVLFHRANRLDGGVSDRRLADAIARSGRTVLLRRLDVLSDETGAVIGHREERPTALLAEAARAIGHFETPDHGGVISGYVARAAAFPNAASLPDAAYRIAAGIAAPDCPAAPCIRRFWLYGPPGTIPTYTLIDLLGDRETGLRRAPPPTLEGVSVFIGYADQQAPGATDHFESPFLFAGDSRMPGVELTATAFLNLLEGKPLHRPGPLSRGLIVGAAALTLLTAALTLPGRAGLIALFGLSAAYLMFAHTLFAHARIWIPVALPLMAALPLSLYLWLSLRFGLARRLIDRMAPPEWTDIMLAGESRGRPFSEIAEAAILVTDLEGSTLVAERIGSAAYEGFLRAYHEIENACVELQGGFVDKFTGDGALAVFMGRRADAPGRRRAPDERPPALRACAAAAAIAERVERHNGAQRALGAEASRMRIALDAGPVAMGQIGGGDRLSFDVVGDPVNTAAKLQALGKSIAPGAETVVLCTRAIRDQALELGADRVLGLRFTPCGRHRLDGRAAPIEVFRLERMPTPG